MAEQLTLSQFIKLLENVEKDSEGKDKEIRFDFVYMQPAGISSYRGDYSHLALHYEQSSFETKNSTVSDVLTYCKKAVGEYFTGWKGGEFFMTVNTPLWVANPGETGGTAVVGIKERYVVVIQTEEID